MYIIVEHINLQELVEDVNNLLEQGIEVLGGVSTNGKTYVQAMIGEPKETRSVGVDIDMITVSRYHRNPDAFCEGELFIDYIYKGAEYSMVTKDAINTNNRQALLLTCYEDAMAKGL